MKKISLSDYTVNQGGKDFPYIMREALTEILFHTGLKIFALDLLKRDDLARKIQNCTESDLLLEEAEYVIIKSAVDKADFFNRNDVEFVKRVLNAETVDVVERGK